MTHTKNGYFSSVGDYFGLDGSEWIGLTFSCCAIPRLKHWSATPLMKLGRIWSEYSWPGLDGRSSGLHAVWLKCQLGVLHQQFANLTGPRKHHIQSEWCACKNNKTIRQSFNRQYCDCTLPSCVTLKTCMSFSPSLFNPSAENVSQCKVCSYHYILVTYGTFNYTYRVNKSQCKFF